MLRAVALLEVRARGGKAEGGPLVTVWGPTSQNSDKG